MFRIPRLLPLMIMAAAGVAIGQELQPVEYRQVATVLNRYCAGCHNDADKEGDFSVASLKSMRAGTPDGPVVIAGQAEQSKILQVLTGKMEPAMPPEDEPQPPPEDVELLRLWIDQGARGPEPTEDRSPRLTAPALLAAAPKHHHVGAACAVGNEHYAVGGLREVLLKSFDSGQTVWTAGEISGKVNSLRMSPDGRWIVVGSGIASLGGEAVLLDAHKGSPAMHFHGHGDSIYCAAVSPDGRVLATGGYDRKVILWNAETGEQVRELSGHNGAIYDLDFDPTGQLLATASADQTIKLWQVATGIRLDTLGQPEGEQRCVRFSPNGRFVYGAGADRQIRKWELVARDKPAINPMLVARFAHESDILQLAFLDENRLLSASSDRTVKLWQAEQIAPLGQVAQLHEIPVGFCIWPSREMEVRAMQLNGHLQSIDAKPTVRETQDQVGIKTLIPRTPSSQVSDSQSNRYREVEPNDVVANAAPVTLPAEIEGIINAPSDGQEDHDLVRFTAKQGEPWIIQVHAARGDSPLDSRIDILDTSGAGVIRTRLQAMRESYFTFRGKDSSTSDDFRLHKWEDMELDEYLYANGEVNRLWLYPRGPDSGFKVYPGFGSRYAFFDTTPLAHALGQTTYIVRELAADEEPLPNGLPVFPVFYENDDDSHARLGKDSRLTFTAPASGDYLLRIRDARGFGGSDFAYKISIRPPRTDFSLSISGNEMSMPIGSGREWSVKAERIDGLEAPIAIELSGLPEGMVATNPLIIEAGQVTALGCLYATDRLRIDQGEKFEIAITARAVVNGEELVKQLSEKLTVTIAEQTEVQVQLMDASSVGQELDELTIRPGETISARVKVERNGLASRIGFGKEDSGRNLPHGAFVDNIGLNGLLITEEQNEREFFITAAPKVQPGRRQFHLRSDTKGNPTTRPIWLNVVPGN